METANDIINVKCTRCGADATIGGKDYFYTCPVCHGQINKEAAKNNYDGIPTSTSSASDTKANDGKVNVKCTYCGANAKVRDKYHLYTCPVCSRQVNTASAQNHHENALKSDSIKWRCPVCGYERKGESAPEKCPRCMVLGSKFVRISANDSDQICNGQSTPIKKQEKATQCRACITCGRIYFNPKAHGFQNNYCIECRSDNVPNKLVEIDYSLDEFAKRVDFNVEKGEMRNFNEKAKKRLHKVERELYEKYVRGWPTLNKSSLSYARNIKNLYSDGNEATSGMSSSNSSDLIFGLVGIILIILFFIAFPTLAIIATIGLVCWIVHEVNERNGKNEMRRQKEFEQIGKEYEEAVESQKADAPWAKKYSTHPCPHCGHYKVRAATWDDKRYSVAFWGAASSKIGTHYKCDHCGNMWS